MLNAAQKLSGQVSNLSSLGQDVISDLSGTLMDGAKDLAQEAIEAAVDKAKEVAGSALKSAATKIGDAFDEWNEKRKAKAREKARKEESEKIKKETKGMTDDELWDYHNKWINERLKSHYGTSHFYEEKIEKIMEGEYIITDVNSLTRTKVYILQSANEYETSFWELYGEPDRKFKATPPYLLIPEPHPAISASSKKLKKKQQKYANEINDAVSQLKTDAEKAAYRQSWIDARVEQLNDKSAKKLAIKGILWTDVTEYEVLNAIEENKRKANQEWANYSGQSLDLITGKWNVWNVG